MWLFNVTSRTKSLISNFIHKKNLPRKILIGFNTCKALKALMDFEQGFCLYQELDVQISLKFLAGGNTSASNCTFVPSTSILTPPEFDSNINDEPEQTSVNIPLNLFCDTDTGTDILEGGEVDPSKRRSATAPLDPCEHILLVFLTSIDLLSKFSLCLSTPDKLAQSTTAKLNSWARRRAKQDCILWDERELNKFNSKARNLP